ncbi:MAG: hypothetical protein D6795_03280 [Deltaproteobacteria bacterium]|nr:MAG: hypothetical protein D6795_03280 [Deltaproteobacteria bacterium]
MDKSIPITIGFLVMIVAISLFLTLGSARITCEVCMDYNGRQRCKTVSGKSKDFVVQTASQNVCAELANGRDDQISCSRRPPTKVDCSGTM